MKAGKFGLVAAGAASAFLVAAGVRTGLLPSDWLTGKQEPAAQAAAPSGDASTLAAVPPADGKAASQPVAPSAEPAAKPAEAATEPATPSAPADEAAAPAAEIVPPAFSLLRVERDGSVVVAGTAAPNSEVELLNGSRIIGKAMAGSGGDFVIALDQPLPPGDFQLVLRALAPGGVSATSPQTAIVSVPEKKDGPVLALVEEPGQPSRLITNPEAPAKPADAAAAPAPAAPAETPPEAAPATPPAAETAAAPAAATPVAAAEPAKPEPVAPQPAASAPAKLAIEAVEVEGRQVFVAGSAPKGAALRIYFNDMLIGETAGDEKERFLLEAERDLPVGDSIVRADQLDRPGGAVVARVSVPFHSEADVAEAAPAASVPQAANGAAPAAPPQPSAVIIRKGDSLWAISKRVYGRGMRYSAIYLANQTDIRNPDMIWPGQVFKVPETTPEGEKADMGALKDQAASPPSAN